MTGCWKPGALVELSYSDNPNRKLNWTLERVDMGQGWIGVNTNRVNKIIVQFIEDGDVLALTGYQNIRTEPNYSPSGFKKSRFDILLESSGHPSCYVEIKNATLYENDTMKFPDAVTTRGKKHLELLKHAVDAGYRGVIFFAVNRPEGEIFKVTSEIDPEYYRALKIAHNAGVEIIAFRIRHTVDGVEPAGVMPVSLD